MEKLGWIRVHGKNIETYSLDQNHLDEIISGLNEVVDHPEELRYNIEVHSPRIYLENVPYQELEDGSVTKRYKQLIPDIPEFKRTQFTPGQFPGYKNPGG